MPMTKNQAADARTVLASLANLAPRGGEVAAAGVNLDRAVAEVLDGTPVLGRLWTRAADRHEAAELEALEAAELEAAEDEEVPA